MLVKNLKTVVIVLGLVVSSSSVLQAQGAWVHASSRALRTTPSGTNLKYQSEQTGLYGPVMSSATDSYGLLTPIAVTRAIDGIDIQHYSNLNCTTKKMGGTAKCGGSSVDLLQFNGVVRGYAVGYGWQVERFRVNGPVGGQSKLDMRMELEGTLVMVGSQLGDQAGVWMHGEVYFPSTFSGSHFYGFSGALTNVAPVPVLTAATMEPTSVFDVMDWQTSWIQDTGAAAGETAYDVAYDQIASEILTVPNNTDFVIIHYLRVFAEANGAGNGAVSDFQRGTSFELSLSTPTSGTDLVRLSCIPPGDCNLNGVVDFTDIAPFIAILAAGDFLEQADCYADGVVDFLDITEFINILSGN